MILKYLISIVATVTTINAVSDIHRVAVISSNTSDALNEFVPLGFDLIRVDTVKNLDKFNAKAVLMLGNEDGFTSISDSDWEILQKYNVFIDFVDPKIVKAPNTSLETVFERGVTNVDILPSNSLLNLHKHVKSSNLSSIESSYDVDVWFARVAGYDVATYGLNGSNPIPLLLHDPSTERRFMFTSTRISQCVTSRFAPSQRWMKIWSYIMQYMLETKNVSVSWTSHVSATYEKDETLPKNAFASALDRGVEWYRNALMLPSMSRLVDLNAHQSTIVPFPSTTAYKSSKGQLGVFEGFTSDVLAENGTNPQSINIRNDCTSETAMAFAIRCRILNKSDDCDVASNLLSFAWQHSGIQQTFNPPHGSPQDTFGLLAWETNGAAYDMFYKDDDARSLLAGLAVSSLLKTERFKQNIVLAMLANLRITGINGFGPPSETFANIISNGWQSYHGTDYSTEKDVYSPHYQSYLWACYLWSYEKSNYKPFLIRAKNAIRIMMLNYPSKWIPTSNGITMQRARMILPLAWLVRVEDIPQHREWLSQIVDGLLSRQDSSCGAIQEEISATNWNGAAQTPNNENYGTFEAPLNQENDDPVSDFLYTTNFALLGLLEAAAATKNLTYVNALDRLLDLVVRAQASSKIHNELDGAFFRAFDYEKWEAWGSDADIGWGAWSVETGWTQSWITTVLGLHIHNTSLWDLASDVNAEEEFKDWVSYFFYNSSSV